MEWYSSNEFAAEHGSKIFVWDRQADKQIFIHFLGEWDFDNVSHHHNFPIWRYVHEGIDPIPRNQPERSKREDAYYPHYLKFELSEPNYGKKYHGITHDKKDADDWHVSSPIRSFETHTDNKYAMRCSEHCGNTVRDK